MIMRRNTIFLLLLILALTLSSAVPALSEDASGIRGYIKSKG